LKIWGLTATIGNLEEALEVLVPYETPKKIVLAKEKKKIEILSVLPDELELLPWAGHGKQNEKKFFRLSTKDYSHFYQHQKSAENWYQNLLAVNPDLAGQIAIHHSSIDFELRNWIEDNFSFGLFKSSSFYLFFDLGVDFKPVDTVIQIGSSKGVARFLQRAGRSGHSLETSKIYFVPTHSLELIEVKL
jgi:ATP-dependent Lhr-like helicase